MALPAKQNSTINPGAQCTATANLKQAILIAKPTYSCVCIRPPQASFESLLCIVAFHLRIASCAKIQHTYIFAFFPGYSHILVTTKTFRRTLLEQLSVADFSGEQTRPKVYENCHKKVLGIWFDLVFNVKYRKILIFEVIFLCQKSYNIIVYFLKKKNQPNLYEFFFIEEYKNRR